MDLNYGPCGMAAALKVPVIAANVATDARWQRSPWPTLVLGHGLRSCWSTPILSGEAHQVIGVFALYKREPGSPTEVEEDLTRQFAHIASIAMERAQHDASLRESEARKTAILDSALDCIITADSDARITEFNPAAERTFGYRREEVIGAPLVETIVPPSLREQLRRGFAKCLATGDVSLIGRRVELTAMRADGSEFPVELAITRNPWHGPPSFTGYLRDITERKQSDERLRRSNEALDKVRSELSRVTQITSLGALTASIAHEVNQPLAGILTNANTCLRMLGADRPNVEGALATAERTIRDANRAAAVIKRLRALFSGKPVAAEPVELSDATREILVLSASELQSYRVTIRTNLAEELPPVLGDRVQLQQVILNLVINAAQAMRTVDERPRALSISTPGKTTARFCSWCATPGLAPRSGNWSSCSTPSIRPSPRAWASDFRLAARSSRPTPAGSGRRRMTGQV